jgi:putative membrane protein
VSYLTYHHFQGDTPFTGTGFIRPVYFFILITHIVLSVFALPMALISAFYAYSRRFARHKRIARYTFPIWLYVSVTGVLVFVMLKLFA